MPLFRCQIYCSIFRTVPGNYTRLRRSFQILAHVKSQDTRVVVYHIIVMVLTFRVLSLCTRFIYFSCYIFIWGRFFPYRITILKNKIFCLNSQFHCISQKCYYLVFVYVISCITIKTKEKNPIALIWSKNFSEPLFCFTKKNHVSSQIMMLSVSVLFTVISTVPTTRQITLQPNRVLF